MTTFGEIALSAAGDVPDLQASLNEQAGKLVSQHSLFDPATTLVRDGPNRLPTLPIATGSLDDGFLRHPSTGRMRAKISHFEQTPEGNSRA
ncbi:hypothetical protein [Asaia astilbis]|uniref:hypothetical protein n=1 Tax=Asaia astilbis TaxID=610244 RepID=UPI000471D416|nr:hypothetical protein [Asaia astilbis]